MSISIKAGVRVAGVVPEMAMALPIIASQYAKFGSDCVITSCVDGSHSQGSLHYAGAAMDFRTRNVTSDKRQPLRDAISASLGQDYDAVLESNHIHVEYQPKTGVNL